MVLFKFLYKRERIYIYIYIYSNPVERGDASVRKRSAWSCPLKKYRIPCRKYLSLKCIRWHRQICGCEYAADSLDERSGLQSEVPGEHYRSRGWSSDTEEDSLLQTAPAFTFLTMRGIEGNLYVPSFRKQRTSSRRTPKQRGRGGYTSDYKSMSTNYQLGCTPQVDLLSGYHGIIHIIYKWLIS